MIRNLSQWLKLDYKLVHWNEKERIGGRNERISPRMLGRSVWKSRRILQNKLYAVNNKSVSKNSVEGKRLLIDTNISTVGWRQIKLTGMWFNTGKLIEKGDSTKNDTSLNLISTSTSTNSQAVDPELSNSVCENVSTSWGW